MANYYISAQVKVDTSSVQTQLNAIKDKTINVKVNSTGTTEAVKSVNEIDTSVKKASKGILTLGGDLTQTFLKVLKFGAVTSVIGAFTASITEAIKVTKDFDDALTDFKKVSDLSGDSLTEYTQKLGELGEATARTTTEMVQAATEFKKSGYSDNDSAQLAQVATLYQNVADSELSASDSSAYLISQMKAFNITADDAITIIDKTNEVSNSFAVSSTDVSTALTKTSSAMSAYGNTIDETIGMTTAATEVMTGKLVKFQKDLEASVQT